MPKKRDLTDEEKVRHKNFLFLLESYDDYKTFGAALEPPVTEGYIGMIARGEKSISRKTAKKWESALKLGKWWFEKPQTGTPNRSSPADFDFYPDAQVGQDHNLYDKVRDAANKEVRERGLANKITFEMFDRIVQTAYGDLTNRLRTPEEAVRHVLDITALLDPS